MYENQIKEVIRKQKLQKAWNITYKYSVLLNKNKNKNNIELIINDIYLKYLSELKSNKLSVLLKQKYIRIWNNLITSKNKKSYLNLFTNSVHNNIKNNYL